MRFEKKTLEDLEQMAEAGIVHGVYKVDDFDYHAFKALNSTSIKAAGISMADFNAVYSPDPTAPAERRGDHFTFGSAFHAYMLDKEEFNRSFILKPNDIDFRTTAGKIWKKENAHKSILTDVDMYKINEMSRSLNLSPWWNAFCDTEHETELAIFWECEITGFQCKAKLDLISESLGALDLKSTSKPITDGSLKYAIKSFSYHIQQAHYVAGIRACLPEYPTTFTLGFVQKTTPFGARATVFEKSNLELINKEYESLMMDIQYGIENNFYPFVGDGQVMEVDLYGN